MGNSLRAPYGRPPTALSSAALLVLLARSAGTRLVTTNLRHGTDERRLTMTVLGMMMVMAVIVRVIVGMVMPATASVIDGGLQGFARQGQRALRLGLSRHGWRSIEGEAATIAWIGGRWEPNFLRNRNIRKNLSPRVGSVVSCQKL